MVEEADLQLDGGKVSRVEEVRNFHTLPLLQPVKCMKQTLIPKQVEVGLKIEGVQDIMGK